MGQAHSLVGEVSFADQPVSGFITGFQIGGQAWRVGPPLTWRGLRQGDAVIGKGDRFINGLKGYKINLSPFPAQLRAYSPFMMQAAVP
jgi:hypothetical protein